MIHPYRQLVDQIAQETGVERPSLLEEGSPILQESALRTGAEMYLIGLIGGKEVGKSSLVNALVGQEITAKTSYGPGTEWVIAYAHEAQAKPLSELLEREVKGRYRVVTHRIERLLRQVLLDLPDIDSHYAHHIDMTRRMLRHMLFPIWLQSIEKYADRQPRELLAMVAKGNAPRNFLFCLNKVDQVIDREGEETLRELSADYARRIAEQLQLAQPPRIWLISATHPDQHDLPALRSALGDQKSEMAVEASQQWAERRQGESLAEWIDRQDLPQKLSALARIEAAAEEELASRIGVGLIESAVPAILNDPAYRKSLGDELTEARASRWPVVNALHGLIGPILTMLRLPIEPQHGLRQAEDLVDAHLQSADPTASGRSVAELVQTVFATLQQSSPLVSRAYAGHRLWEPAEAHQAQADLKQRLVTTLERQRSVIRTQLLSDTVIATILRILLTFGAILWFPFAQPILQAWMQPGHGNLPLLVVQVLGVNYLLKSAAFLAVYFLVLWLILKWDTQRRVDRSLARWQLGGSLDPTLNLAGQVAEWSETMLWPIRQSRMRMEEFVSRASQLRETLAKTPPT